MLGNVAGVKLGAAVDRGSVALNDDRQLHCASGSKPPDPKPEASGGSLEGDGGAPVSSAGGPAGAVISLRHGAVPGTRQRSRAHRHRG